jgi:hypothetical protein
MTGSSLAGIITAFATLLTAIGGFIVAMKVIIPMKTETTKILTHVNQQHTDLVRRITVLTRALVKEGIQIPEDQSTLNEEDREKQ